MCTCVFACICVFTHVNRVCVCVYIRAPLPTKKGASQPDFSRRPFLSISLSSFFCSVYARVIFLFLPFSDLSVVVLVVVVVVVFTRVVAVLKSVKTYRRSCLGGPTHRRLILLDAHAAYFCYGRFLLAGIVVIIVIPLNARFDYRRLFGRLFFKN